MDTHHPGPGGLITDFLGASHEILPGVLWQTSLVGEYEVRTEGKAALVISCIDSPEPKAHACVRYVFDDGDALPPEDDLHWLGRLGAEWIRAGNAVGSRCVIVHCLAGNNRSGLVCGLIMWHLGKGHGPAIIARIQAANPHALYNETFRKYLESL